MRSLGIFLIGPWALYGVLNWCIYFIAYYAFKLIFTYILFTVYFKVIAIIFSTGILIQIKREDNLEWAHVFFWIAFVAFVAYEIKYDLSLEVYCGAFLSFTSLLIIGEGDRNIDESTTMASLMFSCLTFIFFGTSLLSMGITKLAGVFDII